MDEKTKQRVERRFAEAGIDVFGSSPESGDRRQDAANDHGSERSSQDIANSFFYLWANGRYLDVVLEIERLIREVSARSADSEGVLDVIAKAAQDRIDRANEKIRIYEGKNDTKLAEYLGYRTCAVGMARAVKDIQNQSSEPGLG